MFDRFRVLFAEQATADEVVVFLLVTALAALLLAFALYAVVLALLWRGRLRRVTTLHALLFPRREQLRRYLGEYALAAGTSVLLTLTVAARHDVVETVLDYPLHDVSTERIREVFAFGNLEGGDMAGAPVYDARIASTLTGLTGNAGDPTPGAASFGLESLLLPAVRAGGADRADLWLRTVIGDMGPATLRRFPTERHLLVFAVLLLVGYVGWFAVARSRAVESAGGAGDTDHGRVVGRLLVPAVCIALLLASAASVADTGRISERAAAVAALDTRLDPEGRLAADLLTHAMHQQLLRSRPFRFSSDAEDTLPGVAGALARMEARVLSVREETFAADERTTRQLDSMGSAISGLGRRIERDSVFSEGQRGELGQRAELIERNAAADREQVIFAVERSREAAARAAAMADSLTLLRRALASSESALGDLRSDLRRLASMLPGNGLVLVVTTPATTYQVRAGGPQGAVRGSGQGVGLHALPPGDYTITSGVGSGAVAVAASDARTVQISQRVVDGGVGPVNGAAIERPQDAQPQIF